MHAFVQFKGKGFMGGVPLENRKLYYRKILSMKTSQRMLNKVFELCRVFYGYNLTFSNLNHISCNV